MSDATLHATDHNPDDFVVQIADQVESFLVAVTEVAKGDEPGLAVPFLLLEVSQLLLAAWPPRRPRGHRPRRALRARPGLRAGRRRTPREPRPPPGAGRRLLGGLRPLRAPQGARPGPDLRRPRRRHRRPAPRHGPLPCGPHHGGPVVVAVLLLLQLGLHRLGDAARPALGPRPHPPGPAPRGTERPRHRPVPLGDETLEFEAGRVMEEEIGAPLRLGQAQE